MADDVQILKRRAVWFCALAATGCFVDLLTKQLVFRRPDLHRGSEWWLWEGHIGIQKSLNEGALFGMGQGQVWLFAILSIVAVVAIPVFLFRYRAAYDRWLTLALGFIFGGVLGNLYDRLGLSNLTWDSFNPARTGERVYAVRDFLLFQWNDRWVWPNFNVADALLVIGAGILMAEAIFSSSPADSVAGEIREVGKAER